MKFAISRSLPIGCLCAALLSAPAGLVAAPITFEGTVSYEGAYSGDTLYVAVIDTAGSQDVNLLDLAAYAVGASPLAQPFSLGFDNVGVSSMVFIASFLDVDGGGIDDVGGNDVFGWYGEQPTPTGIPTATSQSALDFALPRAEIHGMITLAPGQVEARIDVSHDVTCGTEGLRPGTFAFASGSYQVIGLYAGSYCISADGTVMGSPARVCYGDPSCANPTVVTLTATEVRSGVDLDFTPTAVEEVSWESVKSLYR